MRERHSMTYSQIGETLGIHPTAARQHYRNALQRLNQYDDVMAANQYNTRPVELPLNRAEWLTIQEGLDKLLSSPQYRGISNVTWNGEEHRPYKYQVLTNLLQRVDQLIEETAPNA